MFFTNFKRIIKAGFVNFWRSGFLSFAAVVVMTLSLTTFGAILFANAFGQAMVAHVKSKVDINVYFTLTAQESDILALQKTINKLPEVASTQYISSTTELANFQAKWQNNSLILQSLSEIGYNPLPAVLNITAKDPSQYASIADFLNSNSALSAGGTSIVNDVNYNENELVINRLSAIISAVEKAGSVAAIIFVLVAVVIIFNTIRIIIYNARDEIVVMKLVGASNTYVKGPFVVSGIIYGVISGCITLIILAVAAYYGDAAIIKLAGIDGVSGWPGIVDIFSTYFMSNFGQIFSIIVGSGIVLGGLSSYVAVRRYLRV
jgi:cell division transport system permease protein